MPTFIIKLTDNNTNYYLEWSTVVDAPVTYGMELEKFREFYKEQYGIRGMEELEGRLARVEKTGCSGISCGIEDLISHNRAGDKEQHLGYKELIEQYCRGENGN